MAAWKWSCGTRVSSTTPISGASVPAASVAAAAPENGRSWPQAGVNPQDRRLHRSRNHGDASDPRPFRRGVCCAYARPPANLGTADGSGHRDCTVERAVDVAVPSHEPSFRQALIGAWCLAYGAQCPPLARRRRNITRRPVDIAKVSRLQLSNTPKGTPRLARRNLPLLPGSLQQRAHGAIHIEVENNPASSTRGLDLETVERAVALTN